MSTQYNRKPKAPRQCRGVVDEWGPHSCPRLAQRNRYCDEHQVASRTKFLCPPEPDITLASEMGEDD